MYLGYNLNLEPPGSRFLSSAPPGADTTDGGLKPPQLVLAATHIAYCPMAARSCLGRGEELKKPKIRLLLIRLLVTQVTNTADGDLWSPRLVGEELLSHPRCALINVRISLYRNIDLLLQLLGTDYLLIVK
jgi:hypothetical protein